MKKKAVKKVAPKKAVKARAAKPKAAPKAAAKIAKPAGRVWGEGPWAIKQVAGGRLQVAGSVKPAVAVEPRPALEDVFNHQVKRQYAPLSRLRAPRGALNWRAVLIIIAVLVWVVALFHPFK
jgi:hypothetical protein